MFCLCTLSGEHEQSPPKRSRTTKETTQTIPTRTTRDLRVLPNPGRDPTGSPPTGRVGARTRPKAGSDRHFIRTCMHTCIHAHTYTHASIFPVSVCLLVSTSFFLTIQHNSKVSFRFYTKISKFELDLEKTSHYKILIRLRLQ